MLVELERLKVLIVRSDVAAVGSVVYVYGGRDAKQVFGDLFALDLSKNSPQWRRTGASISRHGCLLYFLY